MTENEIWAEAVSQATGDIAPSDLAQALIEIGSDTQTVLFSVQGAIVEPTFFNRVNERAKAADSYVEFQDNDIANWAGWIRNTFGNEWGRIADSVVEYGY